MPQENLFGQDGPIVWRDDPAFPISRIIPPTSELKPDKDLVENIRQNHITDPLLLQEIEGPDGVHGRIIQGVRRYLAAKICGIETVPVRMSTITNAQRCVLTVTGHRLRHENFIADIDAIAELQNEGWVAEDIRAALHLTPQELTRRLRIMCGDPRILQLLRLGRCTPNIAEDAAKLPLERQHELLATLEQSGQYKLRRKDIKVVKQARRDEAAAALPQTLFEVSMPRVDGRRLLRILIELRDSGALDLDDTADARAACTAALDMLTEQEGAGAREKAA